VKIIVQRHAILLAALLQVLPVARALFVNPAAGAGFAFVLRWGISAAATLGAVDAVSGATTAYFTSASKFTGTVGVPFTNNITLANTKSDGNSMAVITTNSISAVLTKFGQSTNFAMPPGLALQFLDNVYLISPVYDAICGTPTVPGTNIFAISMIYQGTIVSTNITITIVPGITGLQPPVISSTGFGKDGGIFQFTFSPIAGLTNTVQTNANLAANTWGTMTNIPPPATTSAITIFDKVNNSNQFYRIQIVP